jgi:hypothetical protein
LAAFYQRRTRNPAFAAEWDKVNELIKFQLEEEAYRRGVLGYEEPVYYQGVKCGSITKYSDSLLRFRLKAEMPEKYNPIHKLTVDVSSSDGSMIPRATQLTNEVEVAKLIDMFETSLRLIKEQMEKNDRQAEKKRNLGSKKKTV